MALKMRVESLDEIPEDFRDLYEKGRDGGFELSYDFVKEHPAVVKLRKTTDDVDKKRTMAERALEELQAKYGDLNPDEARAAMDKLQRSGDEELINEGKVEELLEKKTERMRHDFEKQIAAKTAALEELEEKVGKYEQEISDIRIYDTIKDAALSKGARKEALTDIKNRAAGIWKLQDGKPAALDQDGIIMGKRGEPLTIEEWVDTLAAESTYLFEPNSGGGSQGSDTRGNMGGAKIVSMNAAQDDIAAIASGEKVIER